jgi:hypothetical protein
MKLKHEPDRAGPNPVQALLPGQVAPFEHDPPRVGPVQCTQHVQQGALAATRGPDHAEELAILNRQIEPVQGADPSPVVGLDEVLGNQDGTLAGHS